MEKLIDAAPCVIDMLDKGIGYGEILQSLGIPNFVELCVDASKTVKLKQDTMDKLSSLEETVEGSAHLNDSDRLQGFTMQKEADCYLLYCQHSFLPGRILQREETDHFYADLTDKILAASKGNPVRIWSKRRNEFYYNPDLVQEAPDLACIDVYPDKAKIKAYLHLISLQDKEPKIQYVAPELPHIEPDDSFHSSFGVPKGMDRLLYCTEYDAE